MITWKVRQLAEAKGWNIGILAEKAGIAYSSALDFWHGRPRRADLAVMNRLCNALDCTPCDLFAYEPGAMIDGYTESPETEREGVETSPSTGLSVLSDRRSAAVA